MDLLEHDKKRFQINFFYVNIFLFCIHFKRHSTYIVQCTYEYEYNLPIIIFFSKCINLLTLHLQKIFRPFNSFIKICLQDLKTKG